jgi:hypothetical protein
MLILDESEIEELKQRCKKYILCCKKELPEDYADKLINDLYYLLIKGEQNDKISQK